MQNREQFTFAISLSVLNHLGRNLYRSFITVLGEAISNSWDADADNVWIYIDRDRNYLVIKDDGDGMTADDFQKKFLKIGYTKRKDGVIKSSKGRPYVGRKGIGKLALLSCADKITVISKTEDGDYDGGSIDNSGLDKAITQDLTPQEYPLGGWDPEIFKPYTEDHEKGTIVYFENIKDGIRNTEDYLKKSIALYFRFSLLDDSFNIYLNDEKITLDCLEDFASKTQFLWIINDLKDPYINKLRARFTEEDNEEKELAIEEGFKGFIASVKRPSHLKIRSTDERIGIDLFVNGRLRLRDIFKHIPTTRVVESYLYGQVHLDELDSTKEDPFTSSREGIVENNQEFKDFLKSFREEVIRVVFEDWDEWRDKHKEDGDPDNPRLTIIERKSKGLYDAVSKEYALPPDSENRRKVNSWVDDLRKDATFNFSSYAECLISENLVRKLIQERNIDISGEQDIINRLKDTERRNKAAGNINIELRQANIDISYLDMTSLAKLVDTRGQINCLHNDSKQYKPIRDALMHTARLTDEAKRKLTTVYENIKGRILVLLSRDN